MNDYPQYRKYLNDRSWFKILDESSFEELIISGNNYNVKSFEILTFVDRNMMMDMLADNGKNWLVISKIEYENQLEFCKKNLVLTDLL